MMGVVRSMDGYNVLGRWIAPCPSARLGEDAIEPKLLNFFFNAIGDEFGAMALADLKIAKEKLGPDGSEKPAKGHCRGVIVIRGFHARLMPRPHGLVGEAKHE